MRIILAIVLLSALPLIDTQQTTTTTTTSTASTTTTTPTTSTSTTSPSTTTSPTTTTSPASTTTTAGTSTTTSPQSTTTTTGTSTTSPSSTTSTTSPSTTTTSATSTTSPSSTTSTTSSSTTTTTILPNVIRDVNPTADQLWNVNFYYNWFFGLHAYCADASCVDEILKNGIGYDMTFGKGMVGKAVSESAIAAVRSACPTGSQNLRNLGFTKSGAHYVHNLAGTGLKQGWVSSVFGSCGATVPVKSWKSRFTDDMLYGLDMEWNTWYRGMAQDSGNVLFYMWP